MPETPTHQPDSIRSPRSVLLFIIAALLGVVAFFAVYTYMDRAAAMQTKEAQAAAAEAAVSHAFNDVQVQGKGAIVVDLTNGEVLYEKNADAQLPLASITKVAMALAVAEVLDPSSAITIPYDTGYAGSPPTRLMKGETWKISDVMNFTLVASSNEGADILAAAASDKLHAKYPQSPDATATDTTIWRMNDLAHALGMTQTYFMNTNGLDLSATQSGAYSSARDVAKLLAYAASTSPATFAATTKGDLLMTDEDGDTAVPHNTNEALGEIPGLVLGKTGYTDLAGGNLAVVFDVGLAHPVAAVVLGSTESGRFSDMKTLVAAARSAITGQ